MATHTVNFKNVEGHRARYDRLMKTHARDAALEWYVGGGDAISIGFREREFLARHVDLSGRDVVDIGCGIGRLARYLPETDIASYVGTDIIPEVLAAATDAIADPRFKFVAVDGIEIPVATGSADIACAFSVMTHLLDEQVFAYFSETRRALRAGGTAVFSFLDFGLPEHRAMFVSLARGEDRRSDVLKFFEKATLDFFAAETGFKVLEFVDAGTSVTVSGRWSHFLDQRPAPRSFTFGQSVLVLTAV